MHWQWISLNEAIPQGLKPAYILEFLRHDWSRALSRQVQTDPAQMRQEIE
jgi:hypothetical protein